MIKRKKKISHESLCFYRSRYSLARSHAIARPYILIWTPAPSLMGVADDNDCLLPFDEVDLYCEKKYGVYLELPQFTNRRAEQITAYIRTALRKAIQFVEKQKTMIASVTLRKHTAMNLKFDKIWRGNDGKQLENVDTTL